MVEAFCGKHTRAQTFEKFCQSCLPRTRSSKVIALEFLPCKATGDFQNFCCHRLPRAEKRMRIHTHTHTYMHTYIHTNIIIIMNSRCLLRAERRMKIHTHTHAHTHTHTHTHIHTQILMIIRMRIRIIKNNKQNIIINSRCLPHAQWRTRSTSSACSLGSCVCVCVCVCVPLFS